MDLGVPELSAAEKFANADGFFDVRHAERNTIALVGRSHDQVDLQKNGE
jgi:hypothetical protein